MIGNHMKLYKVANSGFDYQELDLEIDDLINYFPEHLTTDEIYSFSQLNLALTGFWPKFKTGFSTIEGEKNLLPDITYWIGATLLLSPRAGRLLGDLLAQYGELLPVRIDGEDYSLFNCLRVLEGVGDPDIDETPKFTLDNAAPDIFKPSAPFLPRIYCTQKMVDTVMAYGLNGVDFIEVE